MMLQLRSMLGNIICWKRIAETCGLLQHIRLKRSSMQLLRTSTSLSNLAFQFLSYSKHSNTKMIRAHSKLEPFMKPNSKRCETGTQPRSIRDQNDSSVGSKLEPFIKLNSKRSETESGTQPRSMDRMIRVSFET